VGHAFNFTGAEGRPPSYLKVTDGCFVRISDISVVGTGVTSSADGSTIAPPVTVAVHLANGSYAAFDPCESQEAAQALAEDLVAALVKAEHMSTPSPEE
jgi:hypothetical protein